MKKSLNISYSAVQGSYWMYFGAIMSFASVFLLSKDYTNSEIGVILALSSIGAVILQPVLADMVDKMEQKPLILLTNIVAIGLIFGTASLYLFKMKSLTLTIVFITLAAFISSLQPIVTSIAFHYSTARNPINFGMSRSFGSVSYAAMTSILGAMVYKYGTNAIPTAGIIILFLLIVSLLITASISKKAVIEADIDNIDLNKMQKSQQKISLAEFIRRNKNFVIFSFAVMLIFFQNSVLNSYLIQILENVGGNSNQMGQLFSFMAVLELPGLFFFTQIRKKLSCQFMLKLSSVAFAFKIFLTYLAGSVSFIYIAFLFQLISFPLFLSSSVHLVDEVMDKNEAVKGQSLITSMMTLSTVFASFIGGFVLDLSGASSLLLISSILAVIGAIIVFVIIDKIKVSTKSIYKS